MRLTFIITGLGIGGAERQICDLADNFANTGHKVLIISLTGDALFLPSHPDIRVVQLCMKRSLFDLIKAYVKARRVIYLFRPEVVHCHMFHAIIFTRLLRLIVPIPILISTTHCIKEKWRLSALAYRLTDRLSDLSTNVSEAALKEFVNKGAWKRECSIMIMNGIDTNHFHFNVDNRNEKRTELGIHEDTSLLLAVGRLVEEKDYPNLLRSFSMLRKDIENVKLAIIGKGKLLANLIILASELDISEHVFFLGEIQDVDVWMSATDLFVLSSEFEGFGLVVAEAMACERMVVSTDCGAVREIIREFGTIVKPSNSEALYFAIKQALICPLEEKVRKGILARNFIINSYSISIIAKRWLSLYQTMQKNDSYEDSPE